MTCRFSRLVLRTAPHQLFGVGRKPKILPMTRADELEQAELHRRAQARREKTRRENSQSDRERGA